MIDEAPKYTAQQLCTHARLRPLALAVSWLAFAATCARADEAANWERLRSMPRERRESLLENLKQFDALSTSEKAAVRALDAKIAALPPEDQARYYSVLRRYHLWVESLTDKQRQELEAAPPDQRMKLVAKFRNEEQRTSAPKSSPRFLQLVDFGPLGPYEIARQIRIWRELTPEQRAALSKQTDPRAGREKLLELAKKDQGKAKKSLAKADEDALVGELESYVQSYALAKGNVPVAALKHKEAQKEGRLLRRWADNYYFIKHPPAPVKPENLLRFESSLPPWICAAFDHVPPDEARRRLTVLYRLVFPAGQEISAATAVKSSTPAKKDAGTAAPKPAPGKRSPTTF